MLFSALVQISGYALFIWRIKLPSHVLQCSEIQITVRETLKLVLSLYNETLRQSPKPSHLKQDSLLAICRSVTSVHVLRRLRISVNSPFPVWTREIMPVNLSHVCNNLPNKPRESHSVTFLFLLMKESFSWGIKSTASACLFFFFFQLKIWLYLSFASFQHAELRYSQGVCPQVCAAGLNVLLFPPFVLVIGSRLAFQCSKHEEGRECVSESPRSR